MRKSKRKKRKKEKRLNLILFSAIFLLVSGGIFYKALGNENEKNILVKGEEIEKEDNKKENPKEIKNEEILITAAGDCTLGTDTNFSYSSSLNAEVANSGNDYGTLMRNVKDIFEKDDYTIVNLETTFTDSKEKVNKGGEISFNFKGRKEFVNILKAGNIEGVTLSNNHIYDYGKKRI